MNKMDFIEHLIYYLESGLSLQKAFELLKIKHAKVVLNIQVKMEQGDDFYEAFKSEQWPDEWLVLFYFFYQTRSLEVALKESKRLYQYQKESRQRMIQKMSYPVLLVVMSMMIGLFFSYFLIPQMIVLKETLAIQSSLMDVFILVFKLFPIFFLIFLGFIVLLVVATYWVLKKPKWLLKKLVKVPLLYRPIQYMMTMRFALYYKELLHKGLTNGEVISFLASQQADSMIQWLASGIQKGCLNGEHLLDVLSASPYLLESFKQMLPVAFRVKEQVVVIEHYLAFENHHYEKNVNTFLKVLLPLIFLMIGSMMIFIYMSFLLPMTSVIDQI